MTAPIARRLAEALSSRWEGVDTTELRLRLEVIRVRAINQLGMPESLVDEVFDHWWSARFVPRPLRFHTIDAALVDIERFLGLERGHGGRGALTRWIAEHAAQLVTLAAVLATSAFGIAYYSFYDAFGVGLEEVSLDSPQTLSHSLLSGVAFVFVGGILISVVLAPTLQLMAARDWRLSLEARPVRTWVFATSVVVAGAAAWVAAGWEHFHYIAGGPRWVAVAATMAVPLTVALPRLLGRKRPLVAWGRLDTMLLPVAAAFVALLLLITILVQVVDHEVEQTRQGRAVDPVELLGLPLFSVRAEPVRLTPAATRRQAVPLPCPLYLGQSSGELVLYDRRRGVVRMAASTVVIQERRGRGRCP